MFTTTILGGLLPSATILSFGLCLAVSAIGFKKYIYIYIISIGYGYSSAAIGSARRLELKQEERYGADPESRAYAKLYLGQESDPGFLRLEDVRERNPLPLQVAEHSGYIALVLEKGQDGETGIAQRADYFR